MLLVSDEQLAKLCTFGVDNQINVKVARHRCSMTHGTSLDDFTDIEVLEVLL